MAIGSVDQASSIISIGIANMTAAFRPIEKDDKRPNVMIGMIDSGEVFGQTRVRMVMGPDDRYIPRADLGFDGARGCHRLARSISEDYPAWSRNSFAIGGTVGLVLAGVASEFDADTRLVAGVMLVAGSAMINGGRLFIKWGREVARFREMCLERNPNFKEVARSFPTGWRMRVAQNPLKSRVYRPIAMPEISGAQIAGLVRAEERKQEVMESAGNAAGAMGVLGALSVACPQLRAAFAVISSCLDNFSKIEPAPRVI